MIGRAFADAAGATVLEVHHIGSTAVQGLRAKPILDLLPVVTSLAELDAVQSALRAAGYAWRGEQGMPGRRYLTFSDTDTGERRAHLHCYAVGSSEITRHVAFRDLLRARPDVAEAYVRLKDRCRDAHPLDSAAYTDCKKSWIADVEARAAAGRL